MKLLPPIMSRVFTALNPFHSLGNVKDRFLQHSREKALHLNCGLYLQFVEKTDAFPELLILILSPQTLFLYFGLLSQLGLLLHETCRIQILLPLNLFLQLSLHVLLHFVLILDPVNFLVSPHLCHDLSGGLFQLRVNVHLLILLKLHSLRHWGCLSWLVHFWGYVWIVCWLQVRSLCLRWLIELVQHMLSFDLLPHDVICIVIDHP